ncbi:MAG: ABC transporter permease [Planctomycetota bacterium]
MSDLKIVLRSLRARAFSSVLVVLLVAVSAGLLLAILSLRSAGERAFARGTGNAHLLVSRDGSPMVSVLNGIFYANPPRAPIDEAKLLELRGSFPWAMFVPTAIGDSYRGFPVVATVTDFFRKFEPVAGEPWRFREGRAFEGDFEIVLGSRVARDTGLRMGAKIVLTHGSGKSREGVDEHAHEHREYLYEVVGILEPTGSPHDRALFSNLESSWILHAHDRFEREGKHKTLTRDDLSAQDRVVTGVLMRLPSRDPSSAPPALVSESQRLRRDGSLTVANPANEVQGLFQIVSAIDVLFVAMAVATLVGSGVAILLSMVNSMAERRRQVAILRVLGASRGRIFMLVLTESTLIGLAGAVLGVVACAGVLWAATGWLGASYGIVLAAELDARAAVLVAMGTTLLAAIAGIAPSFLAYRTSVARALRPLG